MNNKQFRPYGTIGHPLRVWSRLLMQPTGSCLTLRAINLARLIDQNSGIVALTHAAGAHELNLTTQQFRDLIDWALKIQLVEVGERFSTGERIYGFGSLYKNANWEELDKVARAIAQQSKPKLNSKAVGFVTQARAALKEENQPCPPGQTEELRDPQANGEGCSGEQGNEARGVLENRLVCSGEQGGVFSGTDLQGQTPCAATGLKRETTTETPTETSKIKDSTRALFQVAIDQDARKREQAKVEQQASASGSGPAEMSEQPEQPDQVNQPEQLEQQEQPEVDYVLLDLPFLELADPRAFDTREWGQLSREEREQLSSVIPFDRYGELWVEQVCYSFWYAGVDGENNRLLLSHPSDRYYSLELTTANNSSTVEPTDIEQPLSNSSSNELQKGDLVLFNDREYVVSQKLGWDNDQCQLTSINTGRSITVDKDTIKLLKKAQQLSAQD
jgi:hypothetical protein